MKKNYFLAKPKIILISRGELIRIVDFHSKIIEKEKKRKRKQKKSREIQEHYALIK